MRLPLPLLLGAVSGVALVVAGPPRGYYPLTFVALVPLLAGIHRSAVGSSALVGWVAGGVVYAFALPWLPATIARLQHRPWEWALSVALIYFAYHSLQFALFAAGVSLVWRYKENREGDRYLLTTASIASWWVIVEAAFPQVLPWTLGSVLGPASWLRQAADVGGALGLSFVVVCVNALLVEALRGHRPRPVALRAVVGALALVGVLALYGVVRNRALADVQAALAADRGRALRIAIVQGGVGLEPVELPGTDGAAWRRYAHLTRQLGPDRADLVIWPESVLPVYLRQNPPLSKLLAELATDTRQRLLVGALDNAGGDVALNSAYLIDRLPAGHELPPAAGSGRSRTVPFQIYHKVRLVPFGEYLPGAGWISAFQTWRTTGALLAGSEQRSFVLDHPTHTMERLILAPSICFEAIFPGWFNGLVRDGAALLVNLTDDSWFGDSTAPAQHLEMTRLRAVETRRWLVRASNSGISAFIDPTGEIVASLPHGEVATLARTVTGSGHITPYVRFGDWVVLMSAAIVGISVAVHLTNRCSRRQ